MSNSQSWSAPEIRTPQQLVRERAVRVQLRVFGEDQTPIAMTSGTYTLFGPDNRAIDNLDAVAVVAQPNGVNRFDIPALSLPDTLTFGEGHREEWDLLHPDGTSRVFERDCAIVRKKLYPVVSDQDLEAEYSDLATYKSLRYSNFFTFIEDAWIDILNRLIVEGHLAYLIRTPSALRRIHKQLSLSKVLADIATGVPDTSKWQTRADKHERLYESAWAATTWKVDYAQTGQPDEHNERTGQAIVVVLSKSPRRRYSHRWGLRRFGSFR